MSIFKAPQLIPISSQGHQPGQSTLSCVWPVVWLYHFDSGGYGGAGRIQNPGGSRLSQKGCICKRSVTPPLPPACYLIGSHPSCFSLSAFPLSPRATLGGPPEFENKFFLPLLTRLEESLTMELM